MKLYRKVIRSTCSPLSFIREAETFPFSTHLTVLLLECIWSEIVGKMWNKAMDMEGQPNGRNSL